MNATNLAQNAYGAASAASAASLTPRDAEYRAFAHVNARLAHAMETGELRDAAEALHDNLRLWNVLAVDCAAEENELPQNLRAQIVYLADFSRLHGAKALKGEAELSPLLEINEIIMKGLRMRAAAEDAARDGVR